MNITYEINKNDFLEFHCKYIFSASVLKRYIKFIYTILITVFFICVLIAFSNSIRIALICMAIIAFLMKNFIFNMYSKTIKRNLLKLFNSDIYKNTFSKTELLSTEQSVQIKSDYATKIFLWDAIYDLHIIDNYLIIRTLSDEIIYVPTNNSDHLEEIRKFIEDITNHSGIKSYKKYPHDLKYKGYFF